MDSIDISILQPSDKRSVTSTRDYLFLLRLLSGYRSDWKYCTMVGDEESGSRFCLAEGVDGRFFNPITGELATLPDTYSIKERTRFKKVSEHFFTSCFGLRRMVSLDSEPVETIRIHRMTIFKDGNARRLRHFLFRRSLKHPLGVHQDSLLEPPAHYFHRVAGVLEGATEAELQKPHFCPLDGIVDPIEVDVRSPDWTWKQLCGRQWTFEVCPKCLFQFTSRLTLMN